MKCGSKSFCYFLPKSKWEWTQKKIVDPESSSGWQKPITLDSCISSFVVVLRRTGRRNDRNSEMLDCFVPRNDWEKYYNLTITIYVRLSHRHRRIRKYSLIRRHSPAHPRTRREVNEGHTQKMNESEKYQTHRWYGRNQCKYPRDQGTRTENRIREESRLKWNMVYIMPSFPFLYL